MSPVRRLIVVAFWSAVLFAYVAAVVPQADAPHLGASDKLDHMAAFFTICLLGRLGYRHVAVIVVLALAAAFGAFIELSQALPFVHRDAELGDWIADMAASALGVLAAWPILTWLGRWRGEDP